MICTSLGDITGLFGRRGIDLQLPFAEHESCTANKQEYIFSIVSYGKAYLKNSWVHAELMILCLDSCFCLLF